MFYLGTQPCLKHAHIFVVFQADATLDMERRGFYEQSMKYVLQLQEVQERKKFEFVEIVSIMDIKIGVHSEKIIGKEKCAACIQLELVYLASARSTD